MLLALWLLTTTLVLTPRQSTPCPYPPEQTNCPRICQTCPLKYELKPVPKRIVPKVCIGWNNDSSYSDDGLLGPMLIPIEILSRDQDELHIKCAGGCQRWFHYSPWMIDWKVDGYNPQNPYPFQQGSVVDAQAARHEELDHRWAVLYLPPEDMGPSETRTVKITAKIKDLGPEGTDKDTTVTIAGTVKRSNEVWSVDLHLVSIDIPDETPEACEGSSEPCELVNPHWDPDSPPSQCFTDLPTVMYVNEVRALTFEAQDLDRILAECGIPTEPCSTFCNKRFYDEISYEWSITHVQPSDTGNGIIEQFGSLAPGSTHVPRAQTIMFSAIKKGRLRLLIRAVTTEAGDFAVFSHDFEIFERHTKWVDHKPANQHEIFLDGSDVISYSNASIGGWPGTEWQDNNDDGDATDLYDFNFPMAYTRNTEPKLNFFIQSAVQGPTMPGAIVFGSDASVNPPIQYIGRMDQTIHRAFPNWLPSMDFWSTGKVPNKVGVFNHKVTWEVTYNPLRAPAHTVEHTYRIYTTLVDPLSVGSSTLDTNIYRHWESAYDISCRAAQDATTPSGPGSVIEKTDALFHGLTVSRKATGGFNEPDGLPIRYWGNVGEIDPNWTNLALRNMLGGNAIGRCQSICQLFKLCLAIQGQTTTLHEFQVQIQPRILAAANPAPFNFTQISAGAPWPYVSFLVKNYNFNPPAGDTAELIVTLYPMQIALGVPRFGTNTDPDRPGITFHYYDLVIPHTAPWAKAIDLPGKPGIGAADPNSFFSNHVLVKVGTDPNYYDPSYGDFTGYANGDAYAAASVAGVIVPDLRGSAGVQGTDFNLALQYWVAPPNSPTTVLTPYPPSF